MTSHIRSKYRKLTTVSLLLAFGSIFIVTQARSEGLLVATEGEASILSLRSDIRVDTEFVTLGDLFYLDGQKGEINVVRAPKPGEKTTIPSAALARFALRQGLYWENSMQLQRVRVVRNSTQVREDEIRDALELAFDDMEIEGSMDIKFQNPNLTIHLPVGRIPELTVESLTHDPGTGRFVAQIRTPLDNDETVLTTVTGQTVAVQIIPVLTRPVPRDGVLTAEDIKMERIPVQRMGANIVVQMKDVVGMQTKRALRPGQPLRSTDLNTPTLIEKGALITMTFDAPGIKLSNVGRALEDGGSGDIINVINPRSKQTVMARVISQNQVSVTLANIQIASAQ